MPEREIPDELDWHLFNLGREGGMTAYLESLADKTLSGRIYQKKGAASSNDLEEFISFLGIAYAGAFVELFFDGAVDCGEKNLDALFAKTLNDVRLIECGGQVPTTSKTHRIAYSVWGMVMLDKLVSSLDRDGVTLAALWHLEKLCEASTESIGHWVRVADRKKFASSGGKKKYEEHAKARKFVQSEWVTHKTSYAGNKSEFSRVYARRVGNEFSVKVTEKTIREIWLMDGHFVSEQTRQPVVELRREASDGT